MKMSQYDLHQIARMSFDEDHAAQRVILTGVDNLVVSPKIDLSALESKFDALSTTDTVKIEKIEVPTIIKEVQIVEVPKIIIQEKLVPIEQEKIVIQEKIQTIEIPVFFKEKEFIEVAASEQISKKINIFQIVQAISLFGIFIKLLFIK